MAKFRPGIPESFDLKVEPVKDLGDYLDESGLTQPRAKGEGAQTQAAPKPPQNDAPVVARPVPQETAPARPFVPQVTSAVAQPMPATIARSEVPNAPREPIIPLREELTQEERVPKPKAPRREISMTPDTLRMSDELLETIRSGSGQRDTKANELFHALVLLVYEVKDELDPHAIPKRGRWGTPTARAYPLELKNAFLRALIARHAAVPEGSIGLSRAANSVA
jgi:hypothetical protein